MHLTTVPYLLNDIKVHRIHVNVKWIDMLLNFYTSLMCPLFALSISIKFIKIDIKIALIENTIFQLLIILWSWLANQIYAVFTYYRALDKSFNDIINTYRKNKISSQTITLPSYRGVCDPCKGVLFPAW